MPTHNFNHLQTVHITCTPLTRRNKIQICQHKLTRLRRTLDTLTISHIKAHQCMSNRRIDIKTIERRVIINR